MSFLFPFNSVPALLAFVLLFSSPVLSQNAGACTRAEAAEGPTRQVFTCGEGLVVEREPKAALRITERSNGPIPQTIEVQGGALLIEVTPGTEPTEIRTPHAIAAVRGTIYVVDASDIQTSVFVVEGAVDVGQPDGAPTVMLSAGEGVDVTLDAPLVPQTWSEDRVETLLARFGR